MKKIAIVLLLSIFFSVVANAGTDGENSLSKNEPESVKDCFETVNRGIFAFNQFLDGVIFEPVARGYRYIPSPIRTGTGNAVGNLSNLVTVPNNLLPKFWFKEKKKKQHKILSFSLHWNEKWKRGN